MKIGQVNLSYIGTQYNTPEGGVLTVTGESGRRRGKNIIWHVECSICSKDKELFPTPFDGNKYKLDQGQIPCACSTYRYSDAQNKIRLARVGLVTKKIENKKYFVEDVANKVCYSGLINQLLSGYNFQVLVPVSLRLKVEKNSGNEARQKQCREEFNKLASEHGFEVLGEYEKAHVPVMVKCRAGHITSPQPSFLKYKGWTCGDCNRGGYKDSESGYLYILTSSKGDLYKVGISNNPTKRIEYLRTATPFEFDTVSVFKHQNGMVVRKTEQAMHKMLKTAGLTGFNGATEWFLADCSILDAPLKLGLSL